MDMHRIKGRAQCRMNALEIAFWYISLDCSQIQLLVTQIQNDNLHCLIEASFGFLANSHQIIRCDQSFSRDKNNAKYSIFSLGFHSYQRIMDLDTLIHSSVREILMPQTPNGRSNEHLNMTKEDRKGNQNLLSLKSLDKSTLLSLPYIVSSSRSSMRDINEAEVIIVGRNCYLQGV